MAQFIATIGSFYKENSKLLSIYLRRNELAQHLNDFQHLAKVDT
jgi:hypothetical protein